MTSNASTGGNGSDSSVTLEGINLSFGKTHVLKGIDLKIDSGEFFAFLGPSGCGKTTLIRMIAGFESAQTGQVFIGKQEMSHLPPWRAQRRHGISKLRTVASHDGQKERGLRIGRKASAPQ